MKKKMIKTSEIKKHPLAADLLKADPRIHEAKRMILQTVQEHQQSITGIRPADPSRKISYDKLIASFSECRGTQLWFPYIGSGFGKGALVELLDGSIKYDFITGIGPHFLGHNHPDLIAASLDAALSNTIMQGNLQQNLESYEFSELLKKASGLDHCFLSTSGAMANENALKIAFQHRYPANRVLAFSHCFAGRSLALSQITDKPSFREGLPSTIAVDYIPFFDPKFPKESTKLAITILQEHLKRHPKKYAIMLVELIQGEGGFNIGSTEFFTVIMKILKQHQVSIFADEVQTFGRTESLFAFQYFNLQEYIDIASVGKLSQVCATLFKDDHKPKPGLLSQTFTGSTASIYAGKLILNKLLNDHYFGADGKNAQIFKKFSKNLARLSKKTSHSIKGPYGIGSMIAFTPFEGNTQKVTKFVHALYEAGVMSFIAGTDPTRVRFLVPAGAVSMEEIDQVTDIIERVLHDHQAG